ncbi:MAG: NAD kinase [Bacteroidota bacterium]
MNIAIFGKSFEESSSKYIQQLICFLEENKFGISVYDVFFDFLKKKIKFANDPKLFNKSADIAHTIDFLISIGGDGTILGTLPLVHDSKIPILGINTGRLGFLSSVSAENAVEAIQLLIKKEYDIDQRTVLKVEAGDNNLIEYNFGLNELSVHKKAIQAMITVHTFLNNDFLNSYWADGLIISTTTGSTAYSLSCGGPILLPESKNFVITPIAPHTLTVRPIVVPDNVKIKLKIESRSKKFMLNIDSRTYLIDSSNEITIQKANFNINLIILKNQKFLVTLRNKLMWGIDKRN